MEDKNKYIGFRASPKERAKVEELAARTERSLSGVMRMLVQRAQLAGPDLYVQVGDDGREGESCA